MSRRGADAQGLALRRRYIGPGRTPMLAVCGLVGGGGLAGCNTARCFLGTGGSSEETSESTGAGGWPAHQLTVQTRRGGGANHAPDAGAGGLSCPAGHGLTLRGDGRTWGVGQSPETSRAGVVFSMVNRRFSGEFLRPRKERPGVGNGPKHGPRGRRRGPDRGPERAGLAGRGRSVFGVFGPSYARGAGAGVGQPAPRSFPRTPMTVVVRENPHDTFPDPPTRERRGPARNGDAQGDTLQAVRRIPPKTAENERPGPGPYRKARRGGFVAGQGLDAPRFRRFSGMFRQTGRKCRGSPGRYQGEVPGC